jgi:signal transduction histidine kinase
MIKQILLQWSGRLSQLKRNLWLRWLAFAATVLFAALVLNAAPLAKYGIYLNYHLNDALMDLLPKPSASGLVKVVELQQTDDSAYLLDPTFANLQRDLQLLLAQKPLFVLCALKLPLAAANSPEAKKFVAFAKSHPNLYFYSYFSQYQPESLQRHPVLGGLNHVFVPLSKDASSPPFDQAMRVIMFNLETEGGLVDNGLLGLVSAHGYPRKVADFKAADAGIRYRSRSELSSQGLKTANALTNKMVVFGKSYRLDEPEYRSESIQSAWSRSSDGLSAAQRLALNLETILLGDELVYADSSTRFWFILAVVLVYGLGLVFLPPLAGFWWGFICLGLSLVLAAAAYLGLGTMINMGQVVLGLFLGHFILGSGLITIYLRRRDKDLADKVCSLEVQRVRGQLLIKSARADIGLRIATQVAHDIRSPLSGIRIAAQKAEGKISEDCRELLVSSVERLQKISDDLLRRFRMGEVFDERSPRFVFFYELINELAEAYRQSWRECEIVVKGDREACLEVNDSTDLERTFCNLFNNAIEAMSSQRKRRIEVTIEVSAIETIIRFSDNGPGVPSEISDQLFDRGVSFGKTGGSGLGLAQVRETVERLHGNIRLARKSTGAMFVLTFPRVHTQIGKLKLHSRAVVVEDNPKVRERWVHKLQAAGIEVRSFAKPEEFLSLEWTGAYTLITDLMFENSEQTGFNVLEAVQDKDIQKILCSSLSGNLDIQRMAHTLADEVLTKARFEEIQVRT